MSYVSDCLKHIKDIGPSSSQEIAVGIKATERQVRDAIVQLVRSGRIENVGTRRKSARYAITDFGRESLDSGSFKKWARPLPKSLVRVPNVGLTAYAMKTQPTSVWGLAA